MAAPPPSSTGSAIATDFGSLLADSSALLSSMAAASSSIPSSASTMGVGGAGGSPSAYFGRRPDSQVTTSYEEESAAHRLLAREGGGFDSAGLGRRARELERRAHVVGIDGHHRTGGGGARITTGEEKKDGGALGDGGDDDDDDDDDDGATIGRRHPLANIPRSDGTIGGLLSAHHEHCVSSAMRRSREWSARLARERVDERLMRDWEERRERFLPGSSSSILGRGYARSSSRGGGGATTTGVGGGAVVASRVPLLSAGGESPPPPASSSSENYCNNIVPHPQVLPPGAEAIARSHLAAIDGHLARRRPAAAPATATTANAAAASSSDDAVALLDSLEDGSKHENNLSPEVVSGYASALSLVRSIAGCRVRPAPSAGEGPVPAAAAGAVGACRHLALQFSSHVGEVVREAEIGGWSSASASAFPTTATTGGVGGANARDICAYAAIVAGRDVADGRGGVWPRLFYCEFSPPSTFRIILFPVHLLSRRPPPHFSNGTTLPLVAVSVASPFFGGLGRALSKRPAMR
jgi:hypothetical protein